MTKTTTLTHRTWTMTTEVEPIGGSSTRKRTTIRRTFRQPVLLGRRPIVAVEEVNITRYGTAISSLYFIILEDGERQKVANWIYWSILDNPV